MKAERMDLRTPQTFSPPQSSRADERFARESSHICWRESPALGPQLRWRRRGVKKKWQKRGGENFPLAKERQKVFRFSVQSICSLQKFVQNFSFSLWSKFFPFLILLIFKVCFNLSKGELSVRSLGFYDFRSRLKRNSKVIEEKVHKLLEAEKKAKKVANFPHKGLSEAKWMLRVSAFSSTPRKSATKFRAHQEVSTRVVNVYELPSGVIKVIKASAMQDFKVAWRSQKRTWNLNDKRTAKLAQNYTRRGRKSSSRALRNRLIILCSNSSLSLSLWTAREENFFVHNNFSSLSVSMTSTIYVFDA